MGAPRGPLFVVTGMHRSGTTQTGRILAHCPGVQIIHEPLNRQYGLEAVAGAYPCDLDAGQKRLYLGLLEDLLEGTARCRRRAAGDRPLKAIARALVGGRTGFDLARWRLRRTFAPSVQPILKDPFAALLSRSLTRDGGRVLALVRHPAAVWLSVKRMGWRFDWSGFAFPDLFRQLDLPVSVSALAGRPEVETIAWLWTAIYTYLGRLSGEERFLLVRHEELCARPHDELRRMADFFGLAPGAGAGRFIAKTMFSATVAPAGRRLHVRERDAAALPAAWRGAIADEEAAVIRAVCGPLVESIYGRWLPG